MKFDDLGISNSFLWFLIALFLVVWLGSQLFGAFINLEILNLRTTNLVSFNSSPFWFSIVVTFKAFAWVLSLVVMYKYAKSKLNG